MTFLVVGRIAVLALAAALQGAPILAQTNRAGRDFDAEIEEALRSAKTAAGDEHLGTLNTICLLPASGGENTSDNVPRYVTDPSAAPPREGWYADPARVFDNLYFVGGSQHSSWALVTSEGIIIIDTIYPYNSEELIVGGLRRLGLDPEDIRYVIISHAHGDHIGGAQMLQERFGARVVMGGPDWDLVERYPNRYRTMAPRRDIVATDGMQITLGDATVTVWTTPGHTPGTLYGGPDTTRVLSGSELGWVGPWGVVYARNLTPDSTGLAAWTEEQIATAIRTGNRPDGRQLAPIMPWMNLARLTEEDALSIAAYLKSLPPVVHSVPDPVPPGQKAAGPLLEFPAPPAWDVRHLAASGATGH